MAQKGTELATVPTEGFYLAPYAGKMDELRQTIEDNIGADQIVPRELPRIRIPTGGGKLWEVPTLEGPENFATLPLVIVHWKTMRIRWGMTFDQSDGGPPLCTSDDGLMGAGDPGGACRTCPCNRFGTADGGTKPGKDCREVRALFVIGTDDSIPFFMPMPVTSIKPVRDYFAKLTQKSIPFWAVETAFSLEQDKNRGGIVYSKAAPNLGRVLNDAERARILEYREFLKPAFDGVELTRDDLRGSDL